MPLRQDFNDIMTVMLCDDNSSTSNSSSDDDLDLLLLENMFPPSIKLNVPRLNIEDLSDIQCEEMFRYENI